MEGPQLKSKTIKKIIIVEEGEVLACNECKFFSRKLMKSGNEPIYSHVCSHPGVPEVSPYSMYGNLIKEKDSFIVETPEWCPFLKTDS